MSSSFAPPSDGYYDRRDASSPAPSEVAVPASSIRPMRLKVLYSFDEQNKNNCLARWPQIINIRTASLDEKTTIGIIELKTCLQAIVAASPELVAKLGQDYTVYAYDYSEYETPLVGQGMLSWVLASSSATPSAPAQQSRTIVTGRVTKNLLGFFTGGGQETLEVKLRLVPVPTCLQSEYLENMKAYHTLSKVMPAGFDAQGWADFLKNNPGILSGISSQQRSESPASMVGQPPVGLEHVQRLVNEGYAPPTLQRTVSTMQRTESFISAVETQDAFRAPSPSPSILSVSSRVSKRPVGRPASSASNRGRGKSRKLHSEVTDPGYVSNDGNDDLEMQGPPKKRAKVVKADPPSRKGNSFSTRLESLRVAASTAASVRVFQPTAVRPNANPAQSLEEPPRAPTPIARGNAITRRPSLLPGRSSLGQTALSSSVDVDDAMSPLQRACFDSELATEDVPMLSTIEDESPEKRATGADADSPMEEPGSSPPVIPGLSPAPSSPTLPPLPNHDDSGFMSGNLDDLFGDGDYGSDRPVDDFDLEMAKAYQAREQSTQAHGEMAAPKRIHGREQKAIEFAQIITGPALTPIPPLLDAAAAYRSRAACYASKGMKAPARDPDFLPPGGLKRPRKKASPAPASAPPPSSDIRSDCSDGDGLGRKEKKWNKEKRKEKIRTKLAQSLEAGEMPPYCENCGAIETPTWRKAYSRMHSGTHEHVIFGEKEGDVVAVEILEVNEDESTRLFKIIKKSLAPHDEGFLPMLLCNPCGLWLSNHKGLRPADLWNNDAKNLAKEPRDPNQPPTRRHRKKKSTAPQITTDDAIGRSEFTRGSEASSPVELDRADTNGNDDVSGRETESSLARGGGPSVHTESQTATVQPEIPVTVAALAALQYAIRSSPGHGSQTKPIELEVGTPEEPARRSLFPSPNRPAFHSLGGNDDAFTKRTTPEKTPTKTPSALTPYKSKVMSPHNQESRLDAEMNLDGTMDDGNLFGDAGFPQPPSPSPAVGGHSLRREESRHTQDDANAPCTPAKQTPTKHFLGTGDFFSSAAKRILHPRTPSRNPSKHNPSTDEAHNAQELTPFSKHLNQLLGNVGSPSRWLALGFGTSPNKVLSHMNSTSNENNSSNSTGTPSRALRASDNNDFDLAFGNQAQLSTSSPPMPQDDDDEHDWFHEYEERHGLGPGPEGDDADPDWANMSLGSSAFGELDEQQDRVEAPVEVKVETE